VLPTPSANAVLQWNPTATGLTNLAASGSGNLVFSIGPTLVNPALGTPTALTLTNATGLPLTTGVTGVLPVANGGSGSAAPSLVGGTNITISGTWPIETITATGNAGGVRAARGRHQREPLAAGGTGVVTINAAAGGASITVGTTDHLGRRLGPRAV
jgi:hypothetical protein